MEVYMSYFFVFVISVICVRLWDLCYGLGTVALMVKAGVNDCLLMLARNIQSVHEINELKYKALELCERGEKFIEFQKRIDKHEINSMKNTVIRNFINPVPKKFNHLVPFDDWDSAMEYVNTELQKTKQEQR